MMRAKHALLAFFVYLGAQIFIGLVVGFCAGFLWALFHQPFAPDAPEFQQFLTHLVAPVTTLFCIPFAGLAVALLALKVFQARRDDLGLVPASWLSILGGGLTGVLAGLAFVVLTAFYVSTQGHEPQATGPLSQMTQTSSGLVVWVIVALLLAPPVEELVFRGVMLAGLCRSWGTTAGAVAVTAIFGLMHIGEAGAFPPAMLVILAMGGMCAWFRLKTGSLLPSWALHTGYNGTLATLILIATLVRPH